MDIVYRFINAAKQHGVLHAFSQGVSHIPNLIREIYTDIYVGLHGSTTTRDTPGGKMKIDIEATGNNGDLFFNGIMSPKVTAIVQDILGELNRVYGDVFFFEVGAHHGYYTLIAANQIDVGTVIAIEPSPSNASRLHENINLNGYENINIHETAVGDSKKRKELSVLDNSQRHRFLKEHHSDTAQNTVSVPVTTFDSLFFSHEVPDKAPVVLRIDVEYHEKEVLNGMSKFISNSDSRPVYIIMEVHNTSSYSGHPVVEQLIHHGFSVQYLTDEDKDEQAILDDIRSRNTNVEILASRLPSNSSNRHHG